MEKQPGCCKPETLKRKQNPGRMIKITLACLLAGLYLGLKLPSLKQGTSGDPSVVVSANDEFDWDKVGSAFL
jgi:hypothetical protein